jgi:NADH-quinone oxidoreductase subunit I
MSKEYELVFSSQEEAIFGKEKLLIPMEKLKDRLDFLHQHR